MSAPVLRLPDLSKPFELFVHERQHLALGMLNQRLGTWRRAVGYFSKQLDNVNRGWPGCLHAVATTVLLIQEARKLTIGQKKHCVCDSAHGDFCLRTKRGALAVFIEDS